MTYQQSMDFPMIDLSEYKQSDHVSSMNLAHKINFEKMNVACNSLYLQASKVVFIKEIKVWGRGDM